MKIHYYTTLSGREPVREYIQSLPEADQIQIAADIRLIMEYGIFMAPIITRKLKGKLWEIKTGIRHQQRIFYCLIIESGLLFLHACKKQKEGAQREDVELAYRRMKEVLS